MAQSMEARGIWKRIRYSVAAFFVLYLAFVLCMVCALQAKGEEPDGQLIAALIAVESGGNDNAVGDEHMANKAYGCLQIRQPCVDDYNKSNGTSHEAKDCLGNRELSIAICRWYMNHYATEGRLGHAPTDQDRARIWNGGPNGYKKSLTVQYWTRVQAQLK